MRVISALKRYRATFKNWKTVALMRALGFPRVKVVTRAGKAFEVDMQTAMSMASFYYKLSQHFEGVEVEPDRVSFMYKGRRVVFYGYRHGSIVEAFNDYLWLTVSGRSVLDIGASIGDTAVAFALRGAKRVVAVEPYPFVFRYAKKNIEANGLSNVELVNAGVGEEEGEIRLTTAPTFSGTSLRESACGIDVPIYTLDTLVARYGPFDALKVDCEGCEYSLLKSERLADFREIQIEYHYGYEPIAKRLCELGFRVRVSPPRDAFNANAEKPEMKVGYIFAQKPDGSGGLGRIILTHLI